MSQLADTVFQSKDLETLTRPLLELLETVTGLESTYLTTVDTVRGVQHILFSRNSREMTIPEGLTVPWDDTLCKRALDEGRACTNDVANCWGDSQAARELGIKTYMSQPVRTIDDRLYGTLCAASSRPVDVPAEVLKTFTLFARIIAQQVDRERMLHELRQTNAELLERSETDPLTGIANRRALLLHLNALLRQADRRGENVALAFIDLDDFKQINDTYGHGAGDRLLVEIAQRLTSNLRAGDMVARYGGDEFVVAATNADPARMQRRLAQLTSGRFLDEELAFEYGGPSIGVVVSNSSQDAEKLLACGDAAMYEAKQARKRASTTTTH